MLRTLTLVFMIIVFALSQNTELIVQVFNTGKATISYINDCEESEEMEKEEINSDQILDHITLHRISGLQASVQKHYLSLVKQLFCLDKSSPETPPPNVV